MIKFVFLNIFILCNIYSFHVIAAESPDEYEEKLTTPSVVEKLKEIFDIIPPDLSLLNNISIAKQISALLFLSIHDESKQRYNTNITAWFVFNCNKHPELMPQLGMPLFLLKNFLLERNCDESCKAKMLADFLVLEYFVENAAI